jgi:hypothetical protein
MLPAGMTVYARLCGWTLARAHARSADRTALAASLVGVGRFDRAIADFAETYADQTNATTPRSRPPSSTAKPKPPPRSE